MPELRGLDSITLVPSLSLPPFDQRVGFFSMSARSSRCTVWQEADEREREGRLFECIEMEGKGLEEVMNESRA